MTKYDEDYLNGLIKKAKKSWEGVDVDSYLSDVRYNLTEKRMLKRRMLKRSRKPLRNSRK